MSVQVSMVDIADRPLWFLDKELTDEFCEVFQDTGGTYRGEQKLKETHWDRFSKVITGLENGETIESD